MIYVVDRIEGQYAICIGGDRSSVTLPLGRFPETVREGMCFSCKGNGEVVILPGETGERKKRNREIMDDLFE